MEVNGRLPVVRCPTCATPWVLRLSYNLTDGEQSWLYQRDCRHKSMPESPEAEPITWAYVGLVQVDDAQ